jgi:exonuclease III
MLAPSSERWTYNYNGTLELVDHQMVNPALRAMLVEGSVSIPHGGAISAASDHAPILATYSVSAP